MRLREQDEGSAAAPPTPTPRLVFLRRWAGRWYHHANAAHQARDARPPLPCDLQLQAIQFAIVVILLLLLFWASVAGAGGGGEDYGSMHEVWNTLHPQCTWIFPSLCWFNIKSPQKGDIKAWSGWERGLRIAYWRSCFHATLHTFQGPHANVSTGLFPCFLSIYAPLHPVHALRMPCIGGPQNARFRWSVSNHFWMIFKWFERPHLSFPIRVSMSSFTKCPPP